jgi:nitrogen fixation NifU-like protein
MSLYSGTIEEHFKHPRNFGKLASAQVREEGVNPICGDRIRIEVAIDANDNISAAGFQGDLCAIAKASGSLLTEMVRGLSIDRIEALGEHEILEALNAEIQPARRKCAMLPLQVMQNGISEWRKRRPE